MENMRSTSFRIPGRIGRKIKHTPSMITTLPKPSTTTAMPLKSSSQAWRGSVEVISDIELTQSDSELARADRTNRERRKRIQPKSCLSGFLLKSSAVSDDPNKWTCHTTTWKKYYAVTSGSILAISDPVTFMLDQRIKLLRAKIREVRLRGRGVLYVVLQSEPEGFLLRFRDRTERRQWYQVLYAQTITRLPPRTTFPFFEEPSPAKTPKLRVQTVAPKVMPQSLVSINDPTNIEKRKSRRRSAIEFLQNFKHRFEKTFKPETDKTIKGRRRSTRLSLS